MKNIRLPSSFEANFKIILIPVVTIITCITIFIFLGMNGYQRVMFRIKQIKDLGSTQKLLENKVDVLRSIPKGILDKADIAILVYPESGNASFSLFQLRKLVDEYKFTIRKIESKTPGVQKEENNSTITIELTYDDIFKLVEFMEKVKTIAPLTRIQSLTLRNIDEVKVAELEFDTYGKMLPTKLPAIKEPIVSLNENEINTLNLMSGLTMPDLTKLEKKEFLERINPFE